MSMNTTAPVSPAGKPLVRFELTTHALRMRCSTPELQRRMLCAGKVNHISKRIASQIYKKAEILFNFSEFSPQSGILGLKLAQESIE